MNVRVLVTISNAHHLMQYHNIKHQTKLISQLVKIFFYLTV